MMYRIAKMRHWLLPLMQAIQWLIARRAAHRHTGYIVAIGDGSPIYQCKERMLNLI